MVVVVVVVSARKVGEAVVERGRAAASAPAGEPKIGGRSFDLSVEVGEAGEAADRPGVVAVLGVFTACAGDCFCAA